MPSKLFDIHQHVVYGVDDGPRTLKTSLEMLRIAAADGISHIVCTSHASSRGFDKKRYDRHFKALKAAAKKKGIRVKLYRGNEILYSEDAVDLIESGKIYTLGGSDRVLIEFLPYTPFEMIRQAAMTLYNGGYRPVLAHVERYGALRDLNRLVELRESFGVLTQMNSHTVLSSKGLFGNRWVKKALRYGLIDMIGSDAHNAASRRPEMKAAYELLKSRLGMERARRLCRKNGKSAVKART